MASNKIIKLDTQLKEIQNLADQGKYDDAEIKISRIIKVNKHNFFVYNYRGIILLRAGRTLEALSDFKKVISLNPNFGLAYNYAALCYIEIGNFEHAISFLNKAIKLDPYLLEARVNLGSCFRDLGRFKEALIQFDHALAVSHSKEIFHQLIADIHIKLLKFDEAKQHHLKAIEINPSNFMNYFLLGSDFLWAGDRLNASKNFRKAIELNKNYAQAYYGLSRAEKISDLDPLTINVLDLLKDDALSKSDHVYLNFFMAKIYENLHDSDLFFKHLHQGNFLKKQITNFSIKEFINTLRVAHGIYKNSFFDFNNRSNNLSSSSSNVNLIFIVGMPRSGTSLLEQILSSDPLIFGAGEISTLHTLFFDLFSQSPEKIDLFKKLDHIKNRYLNHISAMTDKKFVTDKLPLNFLWLGYIKYIFPDAKFIHISRDPIATSFSIYKTLFSDGALEFSYDEDDIINFYHFYQDTMKFWNDFIKNDILNIGYEDLVNNPKDQTQLIFSYLNLKFDDSVLDIENNKRSVLTASDLQVRNPIYKGSSESWAPYKKYIEKFINEFKKS
jgi:tetratricopeptide (TPR) repeat protein